MKYLRMVPIGQNPGIIHIRQVSFPGHFGILMGGLILHNAMGPCRRATKARQPQRGAISRNVFLRLLMGLGDNLEASTRSQDKSLNRRCCF